MLYMSRCILAIMKDDLGDRMKAYELALDHVLPPNLPVIARLDGRSFHGFTGRLVKPFDVRFSDAMVDGTISLLSSFAGARGAYVQSDEATLLFINDTRNNEDTFFNYRVQKICSVFASLFATTFYESLSSMVPVPTVSFDCRCFVVPRNDVTNNFIWRQKDCIKNAITSTLYYMLRQSGTGRKKCDAIMQGMTSEDKIAFIKQRFSVDFHDACHPRHARGIFVKRQTIENLVENVLPPDVLEKQLKHGNVVPGQTFTRNTWMPDYRVPLFWEDREYIDSLLE